MSILKDKNNNPFKDRNNKLSSKRIIAFICLGISAILTILYTFWGIGNINIVYAYLSVAGGSSFAIGFENLFK